MKYSNTLDVKVYNGVYYPAEDSYLLLSALTKEKGKKYRKAMDVGCGCGIIALYLLLNDIAKYVIACDINIKAVINTKDNLMNKRIYHRADIIQCDILNPPFRQNEYIDIIVSNPPYLPIDEELTLNSISIEDLSWYGGIDGRSVIEAVINLSKSILVRGGLLYIVQSSISNIDKTLEILGRAGIKGKVVKRVHIFFEDIVVIKAIKQ